MWDRRGIKRPINNMNVTIHHSLRKDRQSRATKVGTIIDEQLRHGNVIGVWDFLKQWYRNASGFHPNPTEMGIELMNREFHYLYHMRDDDLDDEHIETLVEYTNINDYTLTLDEVKCDVKGMKNRCASGPSGLRG